jgi:predicted DNA-binding antitoxin AbrB/MazE fold protein
MTVLEAIVQNGQLVLKQPFALPDGTPVKVRVEASAQNPLLDIAGQAVDMDVADGAEQHDHYIYGTPKRTF